MTPQEHFLVIARAHYGNSSFHNQYAEERKGGKQMVPNKNLPEDTERDVRDAPRLDARMGRIGFPGLAELQQFAKTKQCCRLGTLGPPGTSSEYVAEGLVAILQSFGESADLRLFDAFEHLQRDLANDQVDLAIVPHGYAGIDAYYMDTPVTLGALELLTIFEAWTPPYGLAKRRGEPLPADGCRIAFHPATERLMQHLVGSADMRNLHLQRVNSTSVAAERVSAQEVELALTNSNAAARYGLEFIQVVGPIQMSWSCFVRRGWNT